MFLEILSNFFVICKVRESGRLRRIIICLISHYLKSYYLKVIVLRNLYIFKELDFKDIPKKRKKGKIWKGMRKTKTSNCNL